MNLYEKASKNQYLAKHSPNGNLLRTAEQFNSGNWVVSVWKGKSLQGEYTDNEFHKIRKYFK